MDCKSSNHVKHLMEAVEDVILEENQKKILKLRLQSLVEEYTSRTKIYSISFHTLRSVITIGSLIVPALLSVQYTNGSVSAVSMDVYWIVWMLSLCVTISNAIMTMLKVDKKYFVLNTTLEHIISEGWQFIELSGKFSKHKQPSLTPTHQNQFVFFCTSLEKIRMKNIEEEYYKLTEQHPTQGHPDSLLVPPSVPIFIADSSPSPATQKSDSIVNGSQTTLLRQNSQEID